MYDLQPGLAIGFHGCDEETCQQLLNSPNDVRFNANPYDWLGNGMYFWEDDPNRAQQWALEKYQRGEIKRPAVLGAVIDLKNCCNFLNARHTSRLSEYYDMLEHEGFILPRNEDVKSDPYQDKLLRRLDCFAIEFMHDRMQGEYIKELEKYGYSHTTPYDSVRSAFLEGAPIFPGSELKMKSHIQICVRNPDCILGFFRPRQKVDHHTPAIMSSLN